MNREIATTVEDQYQNKYRISSARLEGWDYGWDASYFVTICTRDMAHYFGRVSKGIMQVSNVGKIAENYWLEIPRHFPFVLLEDFVIMPNHMHGIIVIDKTCQADADTSQVESNREHVETLHATSLQGMSKNSEMSSISPKPGSLSTIIRSFKSAVTKSVRKINPEFGWQTRFYDHIIRNEKSHQAISNYILNNPANWDEDKFYSE